MSACWQEYRRDGTRARKRESPPRPRAGNSQRLDAHGEWPTRTSSFVLAVGKKATRPDVRRGKNNNGTTVAADEAIQGFLRGEALGPRYGRRAASSAMSPCVRARARATSQFAAEKARAERRPSGSRRRLVRARFPVAVACTLERVPTRGLFAARVTLALPYRRISLSLSLSASRGTFLGKSRVTAIRYESQANNKEERIRSTVAEGAGGGGGGRAIGPPPVTLFN